MGTARFHILRDEIRMTLTSPWRADFPGMRALDAEGQTYLDSAATAQKPQAVLDALLALSLIHI